METSGKIRRRKLVKKENISEIARSLNFSRNTVKKYLRTGAEPVYQRSKQNCPKLGEHQSQLAAWLEQDAARPKCQRRTAQRFYEGLQREGYAGACDSVQRFVKRWLLSQAMINTWVPTTDSHFAQSGNCQMKSQLLHLNYPAK